MTVTIRIENTYEDGHESETTVEVEDPEEPDDADYMEEWWDTEVFEHTGDGHGEKHPKLGALYTATIINADDKKFVGLSREWD